MASTTIDEYEKIARYYDLTHAHLTEDIPFVIQLAKRAGGDVLELGCGSGRLALPLAAAGISVTGIDNSPAMLHIARRKIAAESKTIQKRIALIQGEMSDFDLEKRFSLIFISHNSFLHLPPLAQRRCLERAAAHLSADGILLLDLSNPLHLAGTPNDHFVTLERTFLESSTGDVVMQFASNRLFADEQRLQISWWYDRTPADGGAMSRVTAVFDYHYLYLHQMETLLKDAGIPLQAVYGDYDNSPYDETSPRLLILAAAPSP